MVTYDASQFQFPSDFKRLLAPERRAFMAAVKQFVEDLNSGQQPRHTLRVKRVKGTNGVWEMTWAPDGRVTFQYGPEQRPGEAHVILRRIGGHDIFRRP